MLYFDITEVKPVHTTNLRKVGGSMMLAIPPALLDILHLSPGSKVGITIQRGRLIVEPRERPRYTMDELIAQCQPKSRSSREDREWTGAAPKGAELV
jgi:antitoxin ChpS